MKYRLGLIIGLLAGCGGPSSISHHGWKNKVKEDPVIEAQEVYFEFEPRTGMVFLRGYAPSVKNPEAVDAESGNLARYVKENRACREIWNFNGLVPVGERGFIRDAKRPDILVIECVLKPDSDNFGYIFEDLISHLARTDVIVSGGQGGSPSIISAAGSSSRTTMRMAITR